MHPASSFPKIFLVLTLFALGSWQCRQAPKAPEAARKVTPSPQPPPQSCGTPHSRTSVLMHRQAAPDTMAAPAAAGSAAAK